MAWRHVSPWTHDAPRRFDAAPLPGAPRRALNPPTTRPLATQGLVGRDPDPACRGPIGDRHERLLHHHRDPLRQRLPAPGTSRWNWSRPTCWPGIGACVVTAGAVPDRHRRQRAQERAAAARGRGPRSRRSWPRNADASPTLADVAGALVRRLHPDQRRPAAPRRACERLWRQMRRARRLLPRAATRACTALAASSSTSRPTCPAAVVRSTASRRSRSRSRTGSSGCPAMPSRCCGRWSPAPAADRAGVPAQRGAGARPRRAGRLQRLARRPARPAGASPCPVDPEQVVYVWWDALGNYVTGLGYGTGAGAYQRLVGGGGRAGARDGQGHRAVPRRLLAGVAALGRPTAAHRRSSCTNT